ncbi:MAG: hydrogenase maturation protease [Anaerolineae bacterium]|nr:hydrogenase maturation protease [Anaerolineae bacterium]
MTTLLIGLGNPILGDDGIGWRVVQAVAAALPAHAAVEVDYLALGGLSLMERLVGYRRAIIVDSLHTRTGRVGQVHVFNLDTLPDLSTGHTTAAHDTSLQTALALGRRMGAPLPQEVLVVGVEAERVYDFSDELSAEVAAAIPAACAAVLELLPARSSVAAVKGKE